MKSGNIMKKSELCAAAQNHLWNGRSYMRTFGARPTASYICTAIVAAADDLPEHLIPGSSRAVKEIQDYVDYYLGGGTFRLFMRNQGIPTELYNSPKWLQMRRKEFLCMLQSKYEREEQ